jgi:NAD(P)-dependent dehydrogenase (short-subunit alcohol dehydrogenase family)
VSRKQSTVTPIIEKILSIDPSIIVRFIEMDLSSQSSIRAAASQISTSVSKVDAIINNAGIMATNPFAVTKEGIEIQFGVNHVGHFLFTNLLIPKIPKGGRIVNVSSSGHCMSGIRFDDYNFRNGDLYDEWTAYGQSKTANILFAMALARRLKSRGICCFSLHPGSTESGLAAHLENLDWEAIEKRFEGKRHMYLNMSKSSVSGSWSVSVI